MGQFHNSVFHGQEPLLKAARFLKFYFLLLTETAPEDFLRLLVWAWLNGGTLNGTLIGFMLITTATIIISHR